MRSAVKYIVIAVAAIVILSPIGELFDETDKLPQDATDVTFYLLCLFFLLAVSIRRGTALIVARLTSYWINGVVQVHRHFPPLKSVSPQDRGLFLTFCDLRI